MAWNGFGKARGAAEKTRTWRWLWCALGVVGIGCAVWWLMKSEPVVAAPKIEKKRVVKPLKNVARNAPVKPKIIAPAVETNDPNTVLLPDGRRVAKPKTIAEAVALVRLKPGYHRYKNVDEVFSKTNDFQVGEYKAPLFKHAIESKLGMIATRRRDMVMPPMPPLPPDAARDFAASLNYVFEEASDEDPKDAETRKRVEAMKLGMKSLMENEGLTVEQAFHAIEREHNRLANMTQLYKGAYIKMRLSGSEDAAAFLEKANEKLREAGACEIDENGRAVGY